VISRKPASGEDNLAAELAAFAESLGSGLAAAG